MMNPVPYRDRHSAGKVLAQHLERHPKGSETRVLALPRGGVPVAFEVAKALQSPLDIFVVRKLGLPTQPELAIGAIASGGVCVLNQDVLRSAALSEEELESIIDHERDELAQREKAYRGDREPLELEGHPVVLVDDGIATGASLRAALAALATRKPSSVIVAAPVGSREGCELLAAEATAVICPLVPDPFFAVGLFYEHFEQVPTTTVRELLETAGYGKPNQR